MAEKIKSPINGEGDCCKSFSEASNNKLHFTAEELAKRNKQRAYKFARIRAHIQEMKEQQENQKKNNNLINSTKAEQNKIESERHEQLKNFRTLLKKHFALNDNEKVETENTENSLDDPYIKDDQHFFELVSNYIKETEKSGTPLYPFIKAIEEYKKDYKLDCVRTLPKNLLLQVTSGCREEKPNTNCQNNIVHDKQEDVDGNRVRRRSCGRSALRLIAPLSPQYRNEYSSFAVGDYSAYDEEIEALAMNRESKILDYINRSHKPKKISYSLSQLKYIISQFQNCNPFENNCI